MKVFLSAGITLALALTAVRSDTTARAYHKFRGFFDPLDPTIDQNAANYYKGYRGDDFNTPWAKYFNDTPIGLSAEFQEGLAKSPVAAELGTPFSEAGAALNEPGYLPLENGFTTLKDGTMFLAIRTDVPPNFTGEMYDFWFSWHINATSKYKLWFPAAHEYAAVNARDIHRNQSSETPYRERYWDLTSFVSESLGRTTTKLSISFFDPRLLGLAPTHAPTGVQALVAGFVLNGVYLDQDPNEMARRGVGPFDTVLAHQVRRTPDGEGMEIRSRFWFGWGVVALMRVVVDPGVLARELSEHCAREMSHLGTFLPALFGEFGGDRPV